MNKHDGLTQDMVPFEQFNLGAARGENEIIWQVGHAGTRVGIRAIATTGVIEAFMEPAQALELAGSLTMMAQNVLMWEGIEGNVRRDAQVTPPSITMTVPTGGKT